MKKGIIMEETNKTFIVMTSDGDFHEIDKSDKANIGQEIRFTPIIKKKENLSLTIIPSYKWFVSFLAILLFILTPLSTHFFNPNPNKTYAYMTIDINPSIGLALDGSLNVVDTFSYNDDGDDLLNIIGIMEGKSLKEVTNAIIRSSKKKGYLKANNEVMISMSYTEDNERIKDKSDKMIKEVRIENNVLITSTLLENDLVKQANKQGISPNKFALKQNALEQGIRIENINSKTISEISSEFSRSNRPLSRKNKQTSPIKQNEKIKQKKDAPKPDKSKKVKPETIGETTKHNNQINKSKNHITNKNEQKKENKPSKQSKKPHSDNNATYKKDNKRGNEHVERQNIKKEDKNTNKKTTPAKGQANKEAKSNNKSDHRKPKK